MRVMISCGEPSGDLYAGALAEEILRQEPSAALVGLGGDRLAAAGATLIENFSGLSVTGLLEVVRVLPRTYATYRRLVADAVATPPDVFVAVDFPDFNFTLARALKKQGIPIVYYISPQLWAWRSGRMQTMKRIADRVLVIFPFEEQIYRDAGVPVEWVGHPLLEIVEDARQKYSRDATRATVYGWICRLRRGATSAIPTRSPNPATWLLRCTRGTSGHSDCSPSRGMWRLNWIPQV